MTWTHLLRFAIAALVRVAVAGYKAAHLVGRIASRARERLRTLRKKSRRLAYIAWYESTTRVGRQTRRLTKRGGRSARLVGGSISRVVRKLHTS